MKISIDIDCSPQEARTFFGLPDIEPLQQEMLEQIRAKMQEGAAGFDPATFMKPFMPENLQSLEALQKGFWDAWYQQMKKE